MGPCPAPASRGGGALSVVRASLAQLSQHLGKPRGGMRTGGGGAPPLSWRVPTGGPDQLEALLELKGGS